jgi:mRNA interferase MazF
LWVMMITSAGNREWPGDIAIPDHMACGLPAPSVVRTAKLATIEAERAERRGAVAPETLAAARQAILRAVMPSG